MAKKSTKDAEVIVKRSERKMVGLFIDGTGLDRATRRLKRKVDLSALVRGVTSGIAPTVSRYYTLIPYEDDSRQRAFLDAVYRAGLAVVIKRLPPKGIARQVTTDIDMAADMVAFARGHSAFGTENLYLPERDVPLTRTVIPLPGSRSLREEAVDNSPNVSESHSEDVAAAPVEGEKKVRRIVVVVCPNRDMSYPLTLLRELETETVAADFGKFGGSPEIIKAAAKWIDLSDSETIWRD